MEEENDVSLFLFFSKWLSDVAYEAGSLHVFTYSARFIVRPCNLTRENTRLLNFLSLSCLCVCAYRDEGEIDQLIVFTAKQKLPPLFTRIFMSDLVKSEFKMNTLEVRTKRVEVRKNKSQSKQQVM